MKSCIVSIVDTDDMGYSLNRYLRSFFNTYVESYFMTYHKSLLSMELIQRADLFILELLRSDDLGFRAEGIFTAEKLIRAGKKTLIFSNFIKSEEEHQLIYWDISSNDSLDKKIRRLLESDYNQLVGIDWLKKKFCKYCRPLSDRHS